MRGFKARHPHLVLRIPSKVNKLQAFVTETKIREWFKYTRQFIECKWKGEGAPDVLKDPARVFNLDETNIWLDPSNGRVQRVVCPRGRKASVQTIGERKQLTMTVAMSADGWLLPPFFLTTKIGLPTFTHIDMNGFRKAFYDTNESGWQNSDSFMRLVETLVREVRKRGTQFPIVLFVDGHKSHVSEEVALYCRANDVILYALLANSTHLLQPLDVGIFGALKKLWYSKCLEVVNQRSELEDVEDVFEITTKVVPHIMREVWKELDRKELVEKAFRKSGIFPFDVRAVDFTKLPEKCREPENLQCSEDDEALGETEEEDHDPSVQQKRSAGPQEARPKKQVPWSMTLTMNEDGQMSFTVPYKHKHDIEFRRGLKEVLKSYPKEAAVKTVVSTSSDIF